MNIKQQIESKLSEIYYSNSGDDYDEYLNVENDAEEILQSILKAIMEKSLKTKESHDNCSCNQCMYVRFRNRNLQEFESVIKEILQTKTNETN